MVTLLPNDLESLGVTVIMAIWIRKEARRKGHERALNVRRKLNVEERRQADPKSALFLKIRHGLGSVLVTMRIIPLNSPMALLNREEPKLGCNK